MTGDLLTGEYAASLEWNNKGSLSRTSTIIQQSSNIDNDHPVRWDDRSLPAGKPPYPLLQPSSGGPFDRQRAEHGEPATALVPGASEEHKLSIPCPVAGGGSSSAKSACTVLPLCWTQGARGVWEPQVNCHQGLL